MEPVETRLPQSDLNELDDRIEQSNVFDSRSQAIRFAVREMLQKANGEDHD